MPKVGDVVQKLVEKTQSGELVWKNNHRVMYRTAEYCNLTFRLSTPLDRKMYNLTVFWDSENESDSSTIGFKDEMDPLVELLDELYPFKKTTKGQAVKLALKCLSDDCWHSSD